MFTPFWAMASARKVRSGSTVTLAQHKAVAIGILGILGIDTHMVDEQTGHQIGHGQRATGMAAASVGGHIDDISAHLFANFGKLCSVHEKPPFQKNSYCKNNPFIV